MNSGKIVSGVINRANVDRSDEVNGRLRSLFRLFIIYIPFIRIFV